MGLEKVDLRHITRHTDKVQTKVWIVDRYGSERVEWLVLGAPQIRFFENKKTWWLSAYMNQGATDFEEDSAYALRLPLIGVTFDGVEYGATRLVAWVDPAGLDEFHVPASSDYDPTKHPDTVMCTKCKKPHPIVPEDFYVPPRDKALFKKVRGQRVIIHIGPVWDEDEDE